VTTLSLLRIAAHNRRSCHRTTSNSTEYSVPPFNLSTIERNFQLSPASATMSFLNLHQQDASKTPSSFRYMDTASAYDLWSEVYDTDGNFLQGLDTIEMKTLLPSSLQLIRTPKPWKLVDLGCGTGRNTLSLLRIPGSSVVGLELSSRMLKVARSRVDTELQLMDRNKRAETVNLELFDMIQQPNPPYCALGADAIISTLVLEHIPTEVFFKTASRILQTDGVLLVTNMHSEMGNISQAGFVDPKTGEKVRPKSYAHCIHDVVAEAKKQGFKLEADVLERGVDEAGSEVLGGRAKKWIGVLVWYGMIFRKTSDGHSG
jgi:SAM-dependent methyltransferase